MYYLVLLFAAVALLSGGRSASVNRHMKLLAVMDNHLEPNAVPIRNSSSKKFIVLTKKPPAITIHEVGTTLELTCEALAAPAPSIHWFKNDAPVYELDLESNEALESNPTSLARLTSTLLVPRSAGRARFACVVVAGAARAKATALVISSGNLTTCIQQYVRSGANRTKATALVISSGGSTDLSERSKLVPLAPRILVSYKVFVDVIGTNVVLPCKARGHPRPLVVWKNQNGTLVTEDPRMKVLRSGELVIAALRWRDLGEYRCEAASAAGAAAATTFLYPAKPNKTDG